jgi:hypothetical protein
LFSMCLPFRNEVKTKTKAKKTWRNRWLSFHYFLLQLRLLDINLYVTYIMCTLNFSFVLSELLWQSIHNARVCLVMWKRGGIPFMMNIEAKAVRNNYNRSKMTNIRFWSSVLLKKPYLQINA